MIIDYLFSMYSDGDVPKSLDTRIINLVTCGLGLVPRRGKGSLYVESKVNKFQKPLVLWGYEASPFCKIVRERLCELEIPHIMKTCARGSSKRTELLLKTGNFQVNESEDKI